LHWRHSVFLSGCYGGKGTGRRFSQPWRATPRVAYPAEYRKRGVISFIVRHDDTVYEKNLGKESTAIGTKMSTFEPGAEGRKCHAAKLR
jgi:hypothetical protein